MSLLNVQAIGIFTMLLIIKIGKRWGDSRITNSDALVHKFVPFLVEYLAF